jgi:hypothetical protein
VVSRDKAGFSSIMHLHERQIANALSERKSLPKSHPAFIDMPRDWIKTIRGKAGEYFGNQLSRLASALRLRSGQAFAEIASWRVSGSLCQLQQDEASWTASNCRFQDKSS